MRASPTRPPEHWTTDGYELEVDDRFDTGLPAHWMPAHLPHWSSRAQAAARYETGSDGLVLRVDADQAPWCPEWDGDTRVSSLQTGLFAGPLGSPVGQHRFRPDAVVREEQPAFRGYLPHRGLVEVTLTATDDADAMVALWMIGLEDLPERSAEVCVCEIFGRDVRQGSAVVGMGLHPFGDPAIVDDFATPRLAIDVTQPHTYGVRWAADDVAFYVDGSLVRVVGQAPQYPMQLMLGLYDFGSPEGVGRARYPRRCRVHRLRGYRPAGATG